MSRRTRSLTVVLAGVFLSLGAHATVPLNLVNKSDDIGRILRGARFVRPAEEVVMALRAVKTQEQLMDVYASLIKTGLPKDALADIHFNLTGVRLAADELSSRALGLSTTSSRLQRAPRLSRVDHRGQSGKSSEPEYATGPARLKHTPEEQIDDLLARAKREGWPEKEVKSLKHQRDLLKEVDDSAVQKQLGLEDEAKFRALRQGIVDSDMGKLNEYMHFFTGKGLKGDELVESTEFISMLQGIATTETGKRVQAALRKVLDENPELAGKGILNPNMSADEIRTFLARTPALQGMLHEFHGLLNVLREANSMDDTLLMLRLRSNLFHNGPGFAADGSAVGFWGFNIQNPNMLPGAMNRSYAALNPSAAPIDAAANPYGGYNAFFGDNSIFVRMGADGKPVPYCPPAQGEGLLHSLTDRYSLDGPVKFYHELINPAEGEFRMDPVDAVKALTTNHDGVAQAVTRIEELAGQRGLGSLSQAAQQAGLRNKAVGDYVKQRVQVSTDGNTVTIKGVAYSKGDPANVEKIGKAYKELYAEALSASFPIGSHYTAPLSRRLVRPPGQSAESVNSVAAPPRSFSPAAYEHTNGFTDRALAEAARITALNPSPAELKALHDYLDQQRATAAAKASGTLASRDLGGYGRHAFEGQYWREMQERLPPRPGSPPQPRP